MTYENEVFTLSVKEFNSLQEQIVKLKTQNFELTQKSLASQHLAQSPASQPKDNSEQLQKLVDRQQKLRKINLKLQGEGKEWKKQAQLLGDKLEREKNARVQFQKDAKNMLDKLKNELNSSWKKKLDLEMDNSKKSFNDLKDRHKQEIKKMKQYHKEIENKYKQKEREVEKLSNDKEDRLRIEMKKHEAKLKYQRGEYEKVLVDMKEKYRNEMKKLDFRMKNQKRENEKNQTESKEKFEARIIQKERNLEKLIQESKDKIRNEQRKQETISKQQQLENERRMVEYREKLVMEKRQMEQKFLQKQKEDEKKINFFAKKKEMEKKMKEDALFQVNELNRIMVKLRKEIKDRDNQILTLNKKTSEIDPLRSELRLEKEKLEKSHEFLDREKREVEKLNNILLVTRKQEKKTKRENHEKFTDLRRRIRYLEKQIESLSEDYVHNMVRSTLSKLTIDNENKEKMKYIQLYNQTKEKCKKFGESNKEVLSQVKVLQVALEDSKIESDISQKQNKQLIRELTSHLKHQKSEFKKKLKRLELEKKELKSKLLEMVDRGMIDDDNDTGDGSRSRMSSSKSSSSAASTPTMKKKSSFKTPPPGPTKNNQPIPRKGGQGGVSSGMGGGEEFNQLKKDNGDLIRKLTKFQKVNWNLEDRLKILQNQIFEREEEIEKKQNIIQNYMMRERLGRLSPMQTMKYHEKESDSEGPSNSNIPSSPGIIRGLFTKKKRQKVGSSQIGFSRMQKVLEETILKNIQLHDNMKIMGEEVARLMEENKKMKSVVNNRKLNSMSKLE